MSHFCKDPEFTLTGREELLAALANPKSLMNFGREGKPQACDKRVKSTFICDLIREIEARGDYPYNRTVYDLAAERLGLPAEDRGDYDGEGKNQRLSWLVYYNQEFTRHDWLIDNGYQPMTDEMLKMAFSQHKKIEIIGSSMLGGTVKNALTVREIGGTLYAMQPRKRKYALRVAGQPARLI